VSVETKIQHALDAIRPVLHQDGGDVELVRFDDATGTAELRLVGNCQACPISSLVTEGGIERRLRAAVPEVRTVRIVRAGADG